jgi:CheY-like chemotaxis protein
VIQFTVADTGIGIPAGKQLSIFSPFTQADSSTTRKYGGTGLGLTISAHLVSMMGGRIWLDSEVGKGTQFHFTARLKVLDKRAEAQRSVPLQAVNGMRILVVDDHRTNRRIVEGILRRWGALTTCAEGGRHALSALLSACQAGQPYRLVVTDMNMPGMDGFALVEQMRRNPELSAVTVMMLTSASHRGDVERCRQLGILAYLFKPVRKRELLTAILAALGAAGSPIAPVIKAAQPVQAKGLRILLAEDNRVNQIVARRMAEKMGHTVVVASNGRLALLLLATQPFDLVLMDVQMPEMDGLTAARKIRESEQSTPFHLPIIAMTAHAMKGDRERCVDAGMDGYVSKPISGPQLEEEIASVMGEGERAAAVKVVSQSL